MALVTSDKSNTTRVPAERLVLTNTTLNYAGEAGCSVIRIRQSPLKPIGVGNLLFSSDLQIHIDRIGLNPQFILGFLAGTLHMSAISPSLNWFHKMLASSPTPCGRLSAEIVIFIRM